MPTVVLPDLALANIDRVLQILTGAWGHFDAATQTQLEELYARMLRECREARYPVQRGTAVARFLAAIDELPPVHELVGSWIEHSRGSPRRSAQPMREWLGFEQLPPTLSAGIGMGVDPQSLPEAPPRDDDRPSTTGSGQLETLLRPGPPAPRPDEIREGLAGATPVGETEALATAAPPAPLTRELESVPSVGTSVPTASRETEAAAPPVATELPTASGGQGLTRYPFLEYPREVALGARTSLVVVLQIARPEATSVAVFVADTAPEPPVLEVVVRARGFDIEDSNTQLLEVARDADADVRFVLIPRVAGEQEIRVDFYQHGRRIGTARQAVLVADRSVAAPVRGQGVPLEPIEIGGAPSVAPDLELCVEADRSDPRVLYFSLHSTVESIDLHHARAGTVRLEGSPLEKMQQVYDRLSGYAGQAPASQAERLEQLAELERIGRNLWDDLVSEELKASYWKWKDRIRTLLITSDEPWISWEIVKPYRFDEENRLMDEPFFCEQFVISRWLSGPGPADRMPMQHLRPVAPRSSGLSSVQEELAFLKTINLLNAGIMADEPFNERGPVIDLFLQGRFNVLHIAAHGGFDATRPDDSSIMLDGGVLRPADVLGRFGGARPRPLIFINACHGARLEFSFTGLGGWADRLVRSSHVGAFVGTAWEVNDRLALLFAEAFYEALLRDGKTLGESFLYARLRIRDADPCNSTWLAYVLYADPGAQAARVSTGVTV